MDKLLILLLFVTAVFVMLITTPDGFLAIMLGGICTVIAFLYINKNFEDQEKIFLRRVFIIALLFRILIATLTHFFKLQEFFGGDSITYDNAGYALYQSWFDPGSYIDPYYLQFSARASGSGWGMAYVVAAIYSFVGRNTFATQIFNCVLGAITAVLVYTCAKNIFNNSRVAKITAVLIAGFPSLVLWSSQGLKDGIICFLLVLAVNVVFSLQKRFNYLYVVLLLLSLGGIYALRFYIFFALVVAIFGSFLINTEKKADSIIKQFAALLVLTVGLSYFGILSSAQRNLETFGNLETLQRSRIDQARSAQSGFGQDIDVSTSEGAIQALPIGLAYLMLAPFPWEISNFRQSITLPEVLVWWALIPFMVFGIWYAVKNKFRQSVAVLVFTLLLTVSYSMFQGNVGTAYRMRAQMLTFYLIFVAAGIVLWKEKKENQDMMRKNKRINRK